ncbi:hypothetical protein AMK68_01830 [candidate division KD3-62 bacterium DG_56]|uniref:ATP synthase gamma chain n=1 Tax=candidate division KD3-62 bacterium DG_56 TaxID=1704032 RepID=A0A0S7XPM5_9BACT|nr:MAG: hypothetical protein AMK68_01830 [candidate division KD3-62 bacterium DG_56]
MAAVSTRDIRRKIRTIRNIQQICRAMKAVASVRLRRALTRLEGARPYASHIAALTSRLAAAGVEHPWLQPREHIRADGFVVIGADKGLCGAYNVNLFRIARQTVDTAESPSLALMGRRPTALFGRLNYDVREALALLTAEPQWEAVAKIADAVGALYDQGAWDRVRVIYTRFISTGKQEVTVEQVLPVEAGAVPGEPSATVSDYIFEPSAERVLARLMPRYLRTRLFLAALNASASEHAARVVAMAGASDNAEEMIGTLTLQYNKARQAAITRELTDIVGTAEALRQM